MISKDKILRGPSLQIPTFSLGEWILEGLRKNGDTLLQYDVFAKRGMTYNELLVKSVKLASIFNKSGIGMGDRIGIVSANHLNHLVVICATIYVGAIGAPYNPTCTEWKFQHILSIAKPKIIFVSRKSEERIRNIVPKLGWQVKLIELDDEAINEQVPTLKDILDRNICSLDPRTYNGAAISDPGKQAALILCSSGTTGLPKGVTLSHRNLINILKYGGDYDFFNVKPGDRMLIFLPFHHGYGICMMLMTMVHSSTGYVMQSFDLETCLSTIEKQRITHLPLVPSVLVLIAKHPIVTKFDYSSLREIVCGAAPLSKDIVKEAKRLLKVSAIRNAYGMTELSIMTCMASRYSDDNGMGYITANVLLKVINPKTNETLGVNEVGELCIKGDVVMLGYYNNRKVTGETIDRDGWLHTGDIGYYDKRGTIYIVDRMKDLIKYKAHQISPTEIETALISHSGVKDVAVVGKPDELCGELPSAFVVRQPGSTVTEKELVEHVKDKLSPEKWLRGGVKFLEAIPRNMNAKILRRELTKLTSNL